MLTFQHHDHNTRVYISRSDFRSARASFDQALTLARSPSEFSSLLQLTSALWRSADVFKMHIRLLGLIDTAEVEAAPELKIAFHFTRCQIKLAMNDLPGFVSDAQRWMASDQQHPIRGCLSALVEKITSPNFPDLEEEKIFAIGLSRTGTTSIHKGLGILGYNAAHFFNPITRSALQDTDFYLFEAFSDTPACVSFERLYHRFPNSKFILTTRNMTEWLYSIKDHMISIRGTDAINELRKSSSYASPDNRPMYGDFDKELYFYHESFQAAFESFHRRVEEFFVGSKGSRLLTLDLSDGPTWGPLCQFLRKDLPNVAFPWANARSK